MAYSCVVMIQSLVRGKLTVAVFARVGLFHLILANLYYLKVINLTSLTIQQHFVHCRKF